MILAFATFVFNITTSHGGLRDVTPMGSDIWMFGGLPLGELVRIRRGGFSGRAVSLELGFELSKVYAFSASYPHNPHLAPVDQDVNA